MKPIQSKSTLAIITSKGVQSIMCYYDGTFETMGKKLLAHYSKSYMPIIKLMRKGTIVMLGENLKKYDKDNEPKGTLDLTGMGKPREEMKVYPTLADLVQTETESEYLYVWDKDRWYGMKVNEGRPYMNMLKELRTLV